MHDADLIVKADFVLKMDRDLTVIEDGAIAVLGGKISGVGTAQELLRKFRSDKILGGEGYVAFPGLVNTHTHAAMVYFRGLGDDMPLKEWLENHIWPAEQKWLSPEFVADAVELACLEMLRGGVTLYSDMYFYGDAVAETTRKMGLRAVVGAGIVDFPTRSGQSADEYLSNAEGFITRWQNCGKIVPAVAPHSPYACSPETLRKAKDLSEKYRVPMHIHLSETKWERDEVLRRHGKTPIMLLESKGALDKSVIAAHCVWPTEDEIGLLAAKGVGVAHCIESNLKLASGLAPVQRMLDAGVKVTFGTDGAASNNDLSIMSEMSTAAKVHKAVAEDPGALNARQAMLMATRWGAEVLGFGDICGSIEEGKAADIVLAGLRKPHLAPLFDIYSQVVYSMNAHDISTVIADGKVLVDCGRHVLADEDEIIEKAYRWGKKIKNGRKK